MELVGWKKEKQGKEWHALKLQRYFKDENEDWKGIQHFGRL